MRAGISGAGLERRLAEASGKAHARNAAAEFKNHVFNAFFKCPPIPLGAPAVGIADSVAMEDGERLRLAQCPYFVVEAIDLHPRN
jgi:hypothetical protein